MKKQRIFLILLTSLILPNLFLHAQGSIDNPPLNAEEVPVPEFIKLDSVDLSKAPEEYTIVTGDTLWDISSRFLESPWYWPKVWSLNPQIENPHLIYPGDKLSFRMTGQIAVPGPEGDVGANAMMTEDELGQTDEVARTGRTLDDRPDNFKDYVQLGGRFQISKFKKMDRTIFNPNAYGFVDKLDLQNSGKIIGSFEPKDLLSNNDSIYVKLGDVTFQPGEYVDFFTVKEEIEDMKGEEVIGHKIEIAGTGKILDVNADRIATVEITRSVTAIERGYYIREHVESRDQLDINDSTVDIKGHVIAGYDPTIFFGESYLIYIDKGSAVGLNAGDMYTVYRRGDALESLDDEMTEKLPWEAIADVVILKTYKKTSTALITKSLVEIQRGDIITTFGGMN